jgi:hypothetical protein
LPAIILRSFAAFIKNYIFKKGFLLGRTGFLISTCNALGTFFKYMKVLEYSERSTPQ